MHGVDGRSWLSGVIDRLHLHRDAEGTVILVEVIDFKTDQVDSLSELGARHAVQMNAYRELMQRAFPAARIDCVLISTALEMMLTL